MRLRPSDRFSPIGPVFTAVHFCFHTHALRMSSRVSQVGLRDSVAAVSYAIKSTLQGKKRGAGEGREEREGVVSASGLLSDKMRKKTDGKGGLSCYAGRAERGLRVAWLARHR